MKHDFRRMGIALPKRVVLPNVNTLWNNPIQVSIVYFNIEDDYYFIVVDYYQSYLHLLTCETANNGGYAIVEGQVPSTIMKMGLSLL